jgi:L-lactate dehydrogenase complex protein LldF
MNRPLPFPDAAPAALADTQLRENLKRATSTIRAKRAAVVSELPDWDELTERARRIKEHTLGHLDHYLTQLEASVERAGGQVHWAADGEDASRIVGDLIQAAGASHVVKVKSITTDEIELNQALASRGIEAVETDLAELIIQLASETSSHFLVPAIHKNRRQIRDLFREALDRPDLTDDPGELAEAARLYLRETFLSASVAVSGANFACADTGTIAVVESEGNGRMCLTLPRTLITIMGIEKVLPRFQDLEVFLQILPRSATGERMNPYTSLWTGVHSEDGPREFHLVLLDNGRTRALADPVGRQALHCIRCSACLNICPVYSRVGGHAYHSPYPGPIGSILTPQLLGPGVHDSLPFASTLCGPCREVCPVRIDIPRVLLHLRGRKNAPPGNDRPRRAFGSRLRASVGSGGIQEGLVMTLLGMALRFPRLYRLGLRLARFLLQRQAADGWVECLPGYGKGWTDGRDLPSPGPMAFRDWWDGREAAEGQDGKPQRDSTSPRGGS